MTTPSERPVFIIGCPRSGTTWLYHLLMSSGGFAIYRSETQLYSRFGPAFRGFYSKRERKAFLDKWLPSEFFRRSGLGEQSFRETVLERVDSPGSMLRTLMGSVCDSQGASRWAECTPDHGLYARQIKRDFPDALFIHINRDGRDVALSLAKQGFIRALPWQTGEPEIAAASYWSWIVRSIREETKFIGDDLMDLRYDDLVDDLQGSLGRIATFVDSPLDVDRITRNPIGAVRSPNTSFTEDRRPKSLKSAPRWQSVYDGPLLRKVESIMAPELGLFGYALSQDSRSAPRAITSRMTRQIYASRFRLGAMLRNMGLSPLRRAPIPATIRPPDDNDPTLRPGQHIQLIREMVQR